MEKNGFYLSSYRRVASRRQSASRQRPYPTRGLLYRGQVGLEPVGGCSGWFFAHSLIQSIMRLISRFSSVDKPPRLLIFFSKLFPYPKGDSRYEAEDGNSGDGDGGGIAGGDRQSGR
jgi:hypothetical protein